MDCEILARIDDQLGSAEVAELCFLCRDYVNKKHLEEIRDAKQLFTRLEEVGLMENHIFLSELLETLRRVDLLNVLKREIVRSQKETDAVPALSPYRKMLYQIYDGMAGDNLKKFKFLLKNKLDRRHIDASETALDLFAKLEQTGFLSSTNVNDLHKDLLNLDQQLARIVQCYIENMAQINHKEQRTIPHRGSMDYQPTISYSQVSESQQQYDAQPNKKSIKDKTDFYSLDHEPHGLCVVINNEKFEDPKQDRPGTQEDSKILKSVFTRLGFRVLIYDNLTAGDIRSTLKELSKKDFVDHDALVVCVLSHGNLGCINGTDGKPVFLQELTEPFQSRRVPALAGKPKLFFIQACQGNAYQGGVLPFLPKSQEEEVVAQNIEEDAGPIRDESVPWDADFLLGMATVPEYKSFRHTILGSIYIQHLCKELIKAAESPEMDDILTVLTRVNRNVSEGRYLSRKQMPEPKYTLTKKLVLRFV